MDRLARDYAGQPVVFLEYPIEGGPWPRNNRFWAARGGRPTTLPEVMVDSGQGVSSGRVDFYNVYKGLVDAALTRPAQADIQASWWRHGQRIGLRLRLTNLSGVALSAANGASVHAVVYEDAHLQDTDRYVRATASAGIPAPLAPGATAEYTLETDPLEGDAPGPNWGRLHFLVLADYRPSGTSQVYDMLQAAVAAPAAWPFPAGSPAVPRLYLPLLLR